MKSHGTHKDRQAGGVGGTGILRTEEAREAGDGVRRRDEARVGVGEDLPAGVEEPLHGRQGRGCCGVGGRGGLLVAAAVLLGGGAGLVDDDGGGREVQHPGRPGVRHLAPSDLHRHVTVTAAADKAPAPRSGQQAKTGWILAAAAGRAGTGRGKEDGVDGDGGYKSWVNESEGGSGGERSADGWRLIFAGSHLQ